MWSKCGWCLLLSVAMRGVPWAHADEPKPIAKEHFAFTRTMEYLDGPRREAMAGRDTRSAFDDRGNVYFYSGFGWGAIRCIRTDGRVVTITGNDYFTSDHNLAEGPASAFGNPTGVRGFSFGIPSGWMVAVGVPDEGEDKGCLYASDPHGGVARIFRNKAKGNRWWFERIIGGGAAKAPTKRGAIVGAKDVGFQRITNVQLDKERRLCIIGDGSVFVYADGKLNCLLGPNDYTPFGPKASDGKPEIPAQGFIGGDGSIYLCTYYNGSGYAGKGPSIWRISSDATKVEPIVRDNSPKFGVGKGGDAMTEATWNCGPHLSPNRNGDVHQPAGTIFPSTHDEDTVRRVMNGRVSILCADGEWRENPARDTPVLHAGAQWHFGPKGMLVRTYSGGDFELDNRMWFYRSVDWARPTLGANGKKEGGK